MIETKHLIGFMREVDDFSSRGKGAYELAQKYIAEIIKRLKEHDALMKCRVMTVDGK